MPSIVPGTYKRYKNMFCFHISLLLPLASHHPTLCLCEFDNSPVPHISRIIPYLSFYAWLMSFIIISSRLIHDEACVNFILFKAE